MAAAGGNGSRRITADVLAGVRHGKTIGAPIAVRIENRDWQNWEKALPVEDVEDTDGADASDPRARNATDGAAAGARGPGGCAEI